MRLLHTSDWHLGQTLHHYERTYEHQCFLDWLPDTLVAEQADALLIAGDVFDTANPSAASALPKKSPPSRSTSPPTSRRT